MQTFSTRRVELHLNGVTRRWDGDKYGVKYANDLRWLGVVLILETIVKDT